MYCIVDKMSSIKVNYKSIKVNYKSTELQCVYLEPDWLGGRSRHGRFMNRTNVKYSRARSREPSRMPVKELQRVLQKSRKIRQSVRRAVRKSFPQSSHIHWAVAFFFHTPPVDDKIFHGGRGWYESP